MSSKKIGVKLGMVDKSDRYLRVFYYTENSGVLLINVYKTKNISEKKNGESKVKLYVK